MNLEIFIPVFIASIILCLKPGPYLLAFLSLAAEGKWKSIFIFWFGSNIAWLPLYALMLKGVAFFPTGFGMLFIFLKSAAAILFISMGLKSLSDAANAEPKEAIDKMKETITTQSFLAALGAGFMVSLSNPYDIIFVLAGIPALIGQTVFNANEIITILVAVMAADIITLIIYLLPVVLFRQILSHTMLVKIRYGTALMLLGIGVYLFISMITQWDLEQVGLLGQLSFWAPYA
jgi:threonine/homoserine/homoserine lactone efflux protein